MNNFKLNITPHVENELKKAQLAYDANNFAQAFIHLENSHVLGQESTYWHVKVHYLMMLWGIKQKDSKEIFGQFIRIIGAALLTAIKGVPTGNTGGSNISPIKVMPISPEFAEIITNAKNSS